MCSDERCWDKDFEAHFVQMPAVAAATRVFWNDLERDMEDPFYRRVHIAASLLMGNIDVQPVEDGPIPS